MISTYHKILFGRKNGRLTFCAWLPILFIARKKYLQCSYICSHLTHRSYTILHSRSSTLCVFGFSLFRSKPADNISCILCWFTTNFDLSQDMYNIHVSSVIANSRYTLWSSQMVELKVKKKRSISLKNWSINLGLLCSYWIRF